MESKLETMLNIAERIMSQLGNHVPPEVELVEELRRLIPEVRKEHGLTATVAEPISGRAKMPKTPGA